MKKKYSKSAAFYFNAKTDFFESNDSLLQKALEYNRLYASQPRRDGCKLCGFELPGKVDFVSYGVGYVFCEKCNHLNGIFDDTKTFVERMYMVDEGVDYASNYLDQGFRKRAIDIYLPKVEFLKDTLPSKYTTILDIGCGSGYFVYSALLRDLKPEGLDVSKTMVDFGNSQIQRLLGVSPLSFEKEEGFFEVIKNTDAAIVSAIGVLEHLREPQKFFEAFQQSHAKYLYYSVPMFSLSTFLECTSNDIFPRQLSGGHTHLFTEESIKQMHKLIGVSSLGEWRFGTDFMDLYRHLMVRLGLQDASKKVFDCLYEQLGSRVDELQAIMDASHSCSEIHVVAERD